MGAGWQRWWSGWRLAREIDALRPRLAASYTTIDGYRVAFYEDGSRIIYAPGSLSYSDGL